VTSLVPALAWLASLVAGCGGGGPGTDIEGTLVFADLGDAEINRLVGAAGGGDMFTAQAQVDQFGDTFMPDPCPNIAISGSTATVTGGCTTQDGVEIGGSATVDNSFAWDQIEGVYGQDASYELRELTFTQSGFTQTYDGQVRVGGDFQSWECDLTSNLLGFAVRSDLHYGCSGGGSAATCRLEGSGLELVGVGGASLSGTVEVSQAGSSSEFTLRGVDTLTVAVSTGCVAWAIQGTDRRSPPCP
jgi:hypothetical protein